MHCHCCIALPKDKSNMQLNRIRLENYRGIEKRELQFPTTGIVVVQGPNDVGKSSIAEAIDIVLDYKATSNNRYVSAIQPVGRDVGTVIELEATTGDYHFTIEKTFNKKRGTSLTIHSPMTEVLTGDEAHNRLQEILNETIDLELWGALCIEQGLGMDQASLGQADWLGKALDSAAGKVESSDTEEPIFDAVQVERSQYFTRTGAKTGEYRQTGERVSELDTQAEELRAEVSRMAQDVDQAAGMDSEIINIKFRLRDLTEDLRIREKSAANLDSLEARISGIENSAEVTKAQLGSAMTDQKLRSNSISELSKASSRAATTISSDSEVFAMAELTKKLLFSETSVDSSNKKITLVETHRDTHQADFNYLRDAFALKQMKERAQRITDATDEAIDAEKWLGSNQISEDSVKKLSKLHLAVEVSKVTQQEASGTVRLHALSVIDLNVDGSALKLTPDNSTEFQLVDPIHITVPDALSIEITPGTSLAEVADSLRDSEVEFEKTCAELGVKDLNEARDLLQTRDRQQAKLKSRDELIKIALVDYSQAELNGWITRYEQRVSNYLSDRDSELTIPDGQEAARQLLSGSQDKLQQLMSHAETLQSEHGDLSSQGTVLKTQILQRQTRHDLEVEHINRLKEDLGSARSEAPDNDLIDSVNKLEDKLEEELGILAKQHTELEKMNPDQVRVMLENATSVLSKANADLGELQKSRSALTGRLESYSDRGLGERVAEIEFQLERATEQLTSIERRANAVDLLHRTMSSYRAQARSRYIEPLRRAIEKKGRVVFDESFKIVIDDQLVVSTRSLGGVPVPYDDIGGGAKEQIGIITRLAIGELTSEQGGVPLIFDDVLGFSDPQKLKRVSAVLSASGKNTQIIVLTCQPDRYRDVGYATIIRLP